MREEKLKDAIFEIYRRAYKEADPPADFDEIMKSGEGQREGFFMNYYLPIERLTEIINEVCKERNIKTWNKDMVKTNVLLGGSPRG